MSTLNANAEPFTPATASTRRASDEERSIFMTFSNGSPLTKQEVEDYFTREYGPCVEYAYVHNRNNRDPEFGRVMFTTTYFPRLILGNRDVVKISVNNKPIWLKKYVPHMNRRTHVES